MATSINVGAGLSRAALVRRHRTVSGKCPLAFGYLGLRLVGKDLQQGCRTGKQWGTEWRGLCRGAGVAFASAEVAVWVYVRRVEVWRVKMVPFIAALVLGLALSVGGGYRASVVAVEQGFLSPGVGTFHQRGKAV